MFHDGVFYMRDKLFGKSFLILSNMIKEYCSLSLHPYLPHIEEVCLGQYPGIFYYIIIVLYLITDFIFILDGMWYRIICDQLKPGELARVHSVDLGNVAFLNSKNMKKLSIELLFHPVHVYLCILGKLLNY